MGATFPRLKNWVPEILTNTDLNAEIDNILNNLGPAGVDDYSSTATQMRIQTSPGTVGSESLATSLAGELERLRYVIKQVLGSTATYWYEAPVTTLSDLFSALGSGGLPRNRIASGRTTGNSSQLCAFVPSGVSASVTLSASVTPLVYFIAGTQYSITADQTITGLTVAPSTNNTCSVNETGATGQTWTKFLGQYGTTIPVDGMNSELASLVGKIAGFKVGSTEYFLANIASTTALTVAWRGSMFDSSANSVQALGFSDNAGITLLKLGWIFANTNSSLAVTYTNPTISSETPSVAATGDYWLDLTATAWKTFNSTTWVDAGALLVGITMQDSAACVAARTFDAYKPTTSLNTFQLERVSNTVVQAKTMFGEANVFGTNQAFSVSRPVWDITTDLESGVVESVSTTYYCYMKENGTTVLSNKAPMTRQDLRGLYHPGETWRCLGSVLNNSSTHFQTPVRSFQAELSETILMGGIEAYDSVDTTAPGTTVSDLYPDRFIFVSSGTAATGWPAAASAAFTDITTITLTPGLWRMRAAIHMEAPNATASIQIVNGILTTTSGNATGTEGFHYNYNYFDKVWGATFTPSFTHTGNLEMFARVDDSTPYYLKLKSVGNGTVNTSQAIRGWTISAERLDDLIGSPS